MQLGGLRAEQRDEGPQDQALNLKNYSFGFLTRRRQLFVATLKVMCFTMCTQAVYALLMFAVLVLTVAAMVTPGWRKLQTTLEEDIQLLEVPRVQGILPIACSFPGSNSTVTNYDSDNYCRKWWSNLQGWERAVTASMIVAVILEAIALTWNCFAWCTCCFKKYLLHPLSPLSFAISVFLAIAISIYAMHTPNLEHVSTLASRSVDVKSQVSYSFWLAVGALILAVTDTLIASMAIFLGKHGV
ncbi:unnamed protein product [Caenorhabditis auriculariae]|uniref:Uncharacterized protein n=1 Tax=Caenorhabditis auriculariae TaxID=2777116 RepID=A0A8S1GQG8_9PELO|nr:unnamed protein product [Caenorhabditis auriculariae]